MVVVEVVDSSNAHGHSSNGGNSNLFIIMLICI